MSLAVLSVVYIVGGVVLAVGFGISYLTYEQPDTDKDVGMNIGVTGGIVSLFFASFVVLGGAILAGKTWGVSGAIITNVLLLPVDFSLFRSGQYALGVIVALVVLMSFVLVFRADSRQWLDMHYAERAAKRDERQRRER